MSLFSRPGTARPRAAHTRPHARGGQPVHPGRRGRRRPEQRDTCRAAPHACGTRSQRPRASTLSMSRRWSAPCRRVSQRPNMSVWSGKHFHTLRAFAVLVVVSRCSHAVPQATRAARGVPGLSATRLQLPSTLCAESQHAEHCSSSPRVPSTRLVRWRRRARASARVQCASRVRHLSFGTELVRVLRK